MVTFLQEEVCYFHNISVVMRTEVHILRHEPVNRLTSERSGSLNQNLQNNVVPLQFWHVYQWTKQ